MGMLKYVLLNCWFVLLSLVAGAQPVNESPKGNDPPGPYLFAEFYPTTILFKSGAREEERLNYNVVREEMVYVQEGTLRVLEMTGIDTIYLGGKKMVPFGKAFCEVLATPSGMVYIRHRFKISNNENPVGYGGYSQTSNTATLRATNMLGDFHQLDARPKYEVEAIPSIWIRKDGRFYSANNSRQLQKVFPAKKGLVKELIQEHKTNFKKPAEVVELLKLLH